jgi:orotidine-5'-phosphate decarboxylase
MLKTIEKIISIHRHPVVLGFDPMIEGLHPFLVKQRSTNNTIDFLNAWSSHTLLATSPLTRIVKYQSAYFEQFGSDGMTALKQAISTAHELGFYVILDAKRCDIASTMKAYGHAAYDELKADALTIVPWMGLDVISALKPWLEAGKGVYTVWMTSNESGRKLQSMPLATNRSIAEEVFDSYESWAHLHGLQDSLGYVLGATMIPESIGPVLSHRQHSLLMPGLGAQGATITPHLKQLISAHPASMLPVSRGITSVLHDVPIESWQDYATQVAMQLKNLTSEVEISYRT